MRKLLLASLLLCAACGSSPETHYYTLSASAGDVPPTHLSVSRVKIPDMLDRPQIVMTHGANQVTLLEYQRWAEPLDSMIQRVLADDLHAQIATNATHGNKLQVRIDELDVDREGTVCLRASWRVQNAKNTANWQQFLQTDSVDADDIPAVVAAMSRLFNILAQTIATAQLH